MPTSAWLERKKEKDDEEEVSPFTVKNIGATESLLIYFLAALEIATANKKIAEIQASIKKTVIALNKLNLKNNYFIETLEREELVDFISSAVRLTGFKIGEEADITENWREW